MIQIKRCNYITGDLPDIASGVSSIIDFLELSGRNYLLFTRGKPTDSKSITTNLHSYLKNFQIFEDIEDLKILLGDNSILFRIDLIVFDFWHLSKDKILDYKKIIDKLEIDYIIVAKEYYYKSSDHFTTDYHIRKELKPNWIDFPVNLQKRFIISDNINKWSSNLEDLIKTYIRDKKIDNLFGDDI